MSFPSRVRAGTAITSRAVPPPLPAFSRARGLGWPLVAAAGSLAAVLTLLLAGTAWIVANSPNSKVPNAAHDRATTRIDTDLQNRPAEKYDAEKVIEPDAAPRPSDGPSLVEHERPNLTRPPDPKLNEKPTAIFTPLEAPAKNDTAPGAQCSNFGTAVAFLPDPTQASRQAASEHKLVFVLHISGNFEDDRFT